MEYVETEGKTIDEAIEKALEELKTEKEYVNIDVIDHGSKGIFNVIGVRPVKIRVSLKYDYINAVKDFLTKVLKAMDIKSDVLITEKDNILNVVLSGENMGIIIGYRGETLDSLQYLVSIVANKCHDIPHKKVILDTENYRNKREVTLKNLAVKTAHKVLTLKKTIKLEPMNAYERRIIHSALSDNDSVCTYSQGNEPYRRVVIDLRK
ncbi:RNA-binding cell elongation regulator Jag/EloR [Clostridium sp. BJN0001]|uniref:RNA-binding cell elongation regulator Jag/EloR n=1 Tax=Clostridium sp. BJN0001 TaxID=2930219 RepID=UPI001FD32434|nr:RNA-binding cell elongation regulator Jag/EloR [Clostridium sp. BJN0001]